jgi:SAM-dependent methyltransferase
MAIEDEDLMPQSAPWCERLALEQRGYFYDWSSTLEPGNGEDLYTELVDKELRPSLDVVDAGCGHGPDVLRVAPRVRSVLGYDRVAAFIDLAEQERRARGIDNARFVCADSKPAGIPVAPKTIDLFLSRRGPRNWIADAKRAGRPGAVLLMLCPISGEVPAWNDELPQKLRFPALAPDHSMRLEATSDDIRARLRQLGSELTHDWYCEVDELFVDPRELYRQRIWGRDRGLVPAYEHCASAFEELFARHARAGRLRVKHCRWIWRAVFDG